jgi:hypothetical protein
MSAASEVVGDRFSARVCKESNVKENLGKCRRLGMMQKPGQSEIVNEKRPSSLRKCDRRYTIALRNLNDGPSFDNKPAGDVDNELE